jgi:hypothetical protein
MDIKQLFGNNLSYQIYLVKFALMGRRNGVRHLFNLAKTRKPSPYGIPIPTYFI